MIALGAPIEARTTQEGRTVAGAVISSRMEGLMERVLAI